MNDAAFEDEPTPPQDPESQAKLNERLAQKLTYRQAIELLNKEKSKATPNEKLAASIQRTIEGIKNDTWHEINQSQPAGQTNNASR